MSSSNVFAPVTDPVQQNHGPMNPSQSAGPQRNLNPHEDTTAEVEHQLNFNLHEDTTAEAEPLPPGWEERYTSDGMAYYIDDNTKTTTWERPSTKKAIGGEPLPPRWEEWHTSGGRTYYVNHDTKNRMWTTPWIKAIESTPLPPRWEERYTPRGKAYYVDHNAKTTTLMRPSTKKSIEVRPLPPGWEEWHTSEGRAFYVDYDTKSKTWTPPWIRSVIESIPLPPGWEKRHTSEGRAYYVDHNTKSDTWTMPTSHILQLLYSHDTSSPDFLHLLYCLIQYDEDEQCLTTLQGSELARLVDFLDKVRAIPSAFHQFTKQTSQALNVIPTTEDVARSCLRELQAICGHHTTLPSSYIVSGEISRVGDSPIIVSAIADVWEGTYGSERVSIKCLRAPLTDNKAIEKVRILCGASLPRLLKNTCGPRSHSAKRPSSGKG